MTTIILPPDIEVDLTQQASREGKTVETVALERLRQSPSGQIPTEVPPRNLKEFLGDMIGCLEGNGEALSDNCGERFTEHLLQKQKAGKI
ncbi:MAG: hypothetical protein ACKV2Q_05335 [Planctomycetaceae bacterium]